MDFLSVLAATCALWWAAAVLLHLGSVVAALAQPAIRRRAETNTEQPPVSIVIPVKGIEFAHEAAFASAFKQPYPRFEVLISAADEQEAAVSLAREVATRFPSVEFRAVCRAVRVAVSPKLNSLVVPLAVAQHDLIFVKDSNIRLGTDQLSRFVRNLTPGVGLVVAVPVACKPASFGAEIERAMMNGYEARLLLAGSALGLGFGHGKVMLFDRRAFTRAGGPEGIADAINEDHYLAKALGRIGLRTVFSSGVIRQDLGPRRIKDIWNRRLRWAVCRRQSEPWWFYTEPLCNCLLAAAAGAASAPIWEMSAAIMIAGTIALWLAAETLLSACKGWGWSWRVPFATLCREPLVLAIWLWTFGARRIVWGDLEFDVRRRAALGRRTQG